MLLQLTQCLEEQIVAVLAEHPWLSAKEIRQLIEKQGQSCSLRGVYKELTNLESEGVVVKVKDNYSLRLAWIVHLTTFTDRLQEIYFDPDRFASFLLEGRDKISWKFKNLSRMDMAWTNIMLGLHRASPGKTMCIWCPHQWFDYAHGRQTRQFMRANELENNRRLHIIGGRTYLDQLAGRFLPSTGKHSFAPGPFEDQRSEYYTLIGDYIITAKLDGRTVSRLEDLFQRVKNDRDLKKEDLQTFFAEPVQTKLVLEKNRQRTQKLKRKFAEYFGVSLEGIG